MADPRVIDLGRDGEIRVLEGSSYTDPANGKSLTGAWIWDASIVLAMWFTTDTWAEGSFKGKRVAELGAGTAVPGMALGKMGANVVLTDRKVMLPGLNANIQENGLTKNVRACELQWGLNPDQVMNIHKAFVEMEREEPRDSAHAGAPSAPDVATTTPGLELTEGAGEATGGAAKSSAAEGERATSSEQNDPVKDEGAGRDPLDIDYVIGSDIMFDPESDTMTSLALAMKSLSGAKTRIFMCCELRPPLPECFRHLHDNGLRWKEVDQATLHRDWCSDDIKIFELFVLGSTEDLPA